jgi:Fur family ferric uptake transcriptional regulator
MDVARKRCWHQFRDFLAGRRLRMTTQRRVIVDLVFRTNQHFTADQLLAWSRRRDKSVSRATVYRNLPLLVEAGLVRELDFGKDYRLYDPNYIDRPDHNHIICLDCGRIFEFECPAIEPSIRQVVHQLGYSNQARRLQITATCDRFQQTGACPHRSAAAPEPGMKAGARK